MAARRSPSSPARVLIVSGATARLDGLLRELQAQTYDYKVVDTEAAALRRIDSDPPDLVLLEVSPPGEQARQLCLSLRQRSSAPIIVFTTVTPAEDLVEYLDSGADGYVSDPGRHHELVARMRALLRNRPVPSGPAVEGSVTVGDVALNAERHEVSVRGRPVQLPRKQFQLLELLMANAGQVLPKALIVRRLWGLGEVPDSNSLAVQISRLRQMIEDDPLQPRRIRTVRGLGYTFVDPIGGSARD